MRCPLCSPARGRPYPWSFLHETPLSDVRRTTCTHQCQHQLADQHCGRACKWERWNIGKWLPVYPVPLTKLPLCPNLYLWRSSRSSGQNSQWWWMMDQLETRVALVQQWSTYQCLANTASLDLAGEFLRRSVHLCICLIYMCVSSFISFQYNVLFLCTAE